VTRKTKKEIKPKILYEVLLTGEVTARKEVKVRASSLEEALGLVAKKRHTATVTVTLQPVAVDDAAKAKEAGEYRYDAYGVCSGCELGILHGNDDGSGNWKYAYVGNEHNPVTLCYDCSVKRGELNTHGGPCLAKDRKSSPSCQYCINGKDNLGG